MVSEDMEECERCSSVLGDNPRFCSNCWINNYEELKENNRQRKQVNEPEVGFETAATIGGISAVNPLTNTIVATTKVDLRKGDKLVKKQEAEQHLDRVLSMIQKTCQTILEKEDIEKHEYVETLSYINQVCDDLQRG